MDDTTEEPEKKQAVAEIPPYAKGLPPNLNQKLKAAIIEFDPLSDAFTWAQEEGGIFYLKAFDGILRILPTKTEGRFDVVFFKQGSAQTVARELTFDYAFASAEGWAKENRATFAVSDLNAPWRSLPISEKQKSLFNSYGFKNGIQDLTRGQAAILIQSGALNKKALRA